MNGTILGWLLLGFSVLCLEQQQCSAQSKLPDQKLITADTQRVAYKIIQSTNQTFGYDIFINGKIYIHQPSVPCLSGTEGFQRKEDADKVAQLVIAKIRKGIMPPTIIKAEMTALDIRMH